MDRDDLAKLTKRPAAGVAVVAVALSALLAGAPASVADPYDDDGGSSYSSDEGSVGSVDDGNSYDGGTGESEPSGGGVEVDEPSGGGVEVDEPGGAGLGVDEPGGGGSGVGEPGGGGSGVGEPGGGGSGVDEPGGSGSGVDEPGGAGVGVDEPGGGDPANGEATSGGMDTGDSDGAGAVVGPDGGDVVAPAETEASPQEVAEASSTEAVTVTSTESTSEEITSYQSAIESTFTNSTYSTGTTLRSPVRAWNSSWISYDRFYRPVFTNPYPSPLQIVYDYGGRPRTFTVPPMQRAVIDVPQSGVYSFTGVTRPGSGPPASVSVGSFSGGGYQPAPGQAPPQKPNAPKPVKNAVVQVSYAAGESEPFRVRSLADLGKDPAMNGAEKVLLDGEVPAWGQWVKSPEGARLFQITETQLIPGVRQPSQDPLPGYEIQLVAAKSSGSWFERNKALVLGVAVGSGVVALIAAVTVLIRRRGAGAAAG